jgi:hypothetical protein
MSPVVLIYKFTDLNTSLDLQQLTYVYKILQVFICSTVVTQHPIN